MNKKRIISVLGWLGGVLILWGYYLISKGKLLELGFYIHGMYLVGSVLLAVDLISSRVWPAVVVNIVFAGVAVSAIIALP